MDRIEIAVGPLTFTARAAGPDSGELVLLLHGFPQTSWEWRHQLAALGDAGFRAIAFDQRGYAPGARPDGVEHYRIEHLVADVLGVADDVGGHTSFHLVGHDFGGAVAWQVAGRHPSRVRTLTVVSTPHPKAFRRALKESPDQQQRSSYMLPIRAEGSTAEDDLRADGAVALRAMYQGLGVDDADEYVRVLGAPGALEAVLAWYRAMDSSYQRDIGPVTSPTLYVWSTDDLALGREGAEWTAEHVEGPYRFEVLEGVSHWIPEHAPTQLNRLLLDHLANS